MNRRDFLFTLGLGAVTLAGKPRLPGFPLRGKGYSRVLEKDLPNIILIDIDDLGWTDLGCYGSGYYETPSIDRLAAEGMKFTDAYAACAVCSPTRASILTGRYPARIGVTDWIHHLDRKALAAVGTGKNPTEYVGSPDRPLLCPSNPYWMELEEVTIAEVLKPAGYVTGHIGKWHLGHFWWYPDKQGFDVNIGGCEIGQPPTYFDPYYQNPRRSSIPTLKPRRQGEYLTDRLAEEAVGFIEKHSTQPFFLHLCPYAVHTPLEAKPSLVAKYEKKKPTNHRNPVYAAMIEAVDQMMGRVMDTLDRKGIAEKTLVIFTSDNGGLKDHSTDNSPLRAGKGYPYEGGIRVPLIIRWPGKVREATMCRVPVSSVDFFPTICEAAGIALPEDRVIDGKSLLGLITETGNVERTSLFWHFPHYRGEVVPYSIIREGKWKLIKRYEGKAFELFDLEEDIGETRDLSSDVPDKVRDLDAELGTWLEEVQAKMPRKNPRYREKNR